MPIVVKVVSEEEYEAWLKRSSEKFASINGDRKRAIAVAEKINYKVSISRWLIEYTV